MSQKTKAICEGAVMVALSLILGMIRLYRLPDGGSITIAILPLVFFAIRHGPSWGFLAGFAFGGLDYILNYGIAIDWTTILCDYFLAYGFLGLGAGLFRVRRRNAYIGTLAGGIMMFLCSYLVGVFVWGKYMPEVFLGMPMTSPWFYSFLYNISWAGPDVVLTLIIFAMLYRVQPMRRYLMGEDLIPAKQQKQPNHA